MINVGIRVIETGIINVAIIIKKECDGLDKRNRAKEYAAIEWKDHDDEETGWLVSAMAVLSEKTFATC